MNRNRTKSIIASLAVSAALSAAVANATDHRMWREQVAPPADSVIQLESIPADPKKKYGNDSLLWREQIKSEPVSRVYILEPAPKSARTSDTRLWRDQIQSNSSKSELTAASKTPHSDKT